jgi:hypothetical protein
MARKKQGRKGGDRGQGSERANVPDSDYLLDAALEHWPHIVGMYRLCKDRGPSIVLYDIQEQRIYVYPYQDFKAELSERSQRSLEQQYEEATRQNQIVVFVRDNDQRRLVSFSLELEDGGSDLKG